VSENPSYEEISEYVYSYVIKNEDQLIANYLERYYSKERLEEIALAVSTIKNTKGKSISILSKRYNLYGYKLSDLELIPIEYINYDNHDRFKLNLITPSKGVAIELIIWLEDSQFEKEIFEEKQRLVDKWTSLLEIAKKIVKCPS
jgi:hypothetical protein